MDPEEKRILDLKYQNKPFGLMDISERTKWAKALIIKIHVITGWVVPDGEFFNILFDQFEKKLSESYLRFNPDEVEYAFRQAGTTVKDWGKNMNLSLIDEVMIPYMEKRSRLSSLEEQQKTKALPAPKESLSDQTMITWLAETRKLNQSWDKMPVMLYDWLDTEGRISLTSDQKKDYWEKAWGIFSAKNNGKELNIKHIKEAMNDIAKKLALKDFIQQ